MLEGMIGNYIDDDNEKSPNCEDCQALTKTLANAIETNRQGNLFPGPILTSSSEAVMLEAAQEQVDEYYK